MTAQLYAGLTDGGREAAATKLVETGIRRMCEPPIVGWTGLTAGRKYLGQIAYQEGGTTHGATVVRVDS